MGLFDSSYESRNMSLDTMTEGISVHGMRDFVDLLKANLLTGVCNELNKTEEINRALMAGWQGQSRDEFIRKFTASIRAVKDDLADEYFNLLKRLGELMDSYFEQDKKMMNMM